MAELSAEIGALAPETFEAADTNDFDRLGDEFITTAEQTAALLATHPAFLLEPWLSHAEDWGTTDQERRDLRADAARLIIVWGDRPAPAWVEDYANRDRSALLSGYYVPRWRRYLTALSTALHTGAPAPDFDWHTEGAHWAASPPRTTTEPSGDPIGAARAALEP